MVERSSCQTQALQYIVHHMFGVCVRSYNFEAFEQNLPRAITNKLKQQTQCTGPSHRCNVQAVHHESPLPQVLERGQADPNSQKGPSDRELQDDCSEWHAVQTVCQPAALHDSRLV
eukprot:1150365-Pelagomonas_calceolata.AAC.2